MEIYYKNTLKLLFETDKCHAEI